MKVRISKANVDAVVPSAEGDVTVWDDRIAGFGLKVTPAGSKVYFYRYRISRPGEASQTAPRKYTIGRHGSLTPDQARKRAQELAALVSQGADPRQQELDAIADQDQAERLAGEQERARRDLAFGRIADLWLAHYEGDMARRKSSVDMARLVVNRYLRPALATTPMPTIGRADLQPILDVSPRINGAYVGRSSLTPRCYGAGRSGAATLKPTSLPPWRSRLLQPPERGSSATMNSPWHGAPPWPLRWSGACSSGFSY